MTTKIPAELSSTPGIVDNSNATAITIGSDETTTFANEVIVQEATSPTLKLDTTSAATSAATLNLEGYRTAADIGSLAQINVINARDGDTHAALHIYASGDTNGYFRFNNTANTQIARLDADGLKFGSDSAAANALDNYEEGTWQAVHGGNNMTGSGFYVKIGSLVHSQGDWTSASGSSTAAVITGLPFNPSTSRGQSAFTVGYTTDSGGQSGGATLFSDTLGFYTNSVAQNLAAGERIIIQGTYSTAD